MLIKLFDEVLTCLLDVWVSGRQSALSKSLRQLGIDLYVQFKKPPVFLIITRLEKWLGYRLYVLQKPFFRQ